MLAERSQPLGQSCSPGGAPGTGLQGFQMGPTAASLASGPARGWLAALEIPVWEVLIKGFHLLRMVWLCTYMGLFLLTGRIFCWELCR